VRDSKSVCVAVIICATLFHTQAELGYSVDTANTVSSLYDKHPMDCDAQLV